MAEADGSEIQIISEPISTQQLAEIAALRFGDMVKAVVDIKRRLLALGGDLHSDGERALLEQGSNRRIYGVLTYTSLSRGLNG